MLHQRTDIITALTHRVNSFVEGYRQNIAIIGEPYTGKTTLIKDLLSAENLKRESIIPIYLEIKIEPFEYCAKRFIKSALFHLLKSDPLLPSPYDTVLLIEDLKRVYPKTAQICVRVMQDVEKGRLDEAYSFMMDIPQTVFEETKKRCVLILDEFHNLDNFGLKHPFGTLSKKIMIQKEIMYILLSSKNIVSQRILNEKLAMLFGNFEKIQLSSFDTNMTRAFLAENIKETAFSHVYLDFLSSFTGSKPFYMRIICEEIDRLILSKKLSAVDYGGLIEKALTETVFKKAGIINQHFSNFFFCISDGKLLSKTAAVLISLSSKSRKQNDIARSSRLQLKEVSRILNNLVEMDIIVRNGSFYRFKDTLFCFWLKSVYLKRIMSFSIDETVEEDSFRKEITNKLGIFVEEFEKELSFRVMGLFKLFKNDVIQLNGKKHKFVYFDTVQRLEDSICNSTNILATGNQARWLCTIKKDSVTESDIAEFIKNSKKKKRENRINRSILISLAGINENAHLMAKEAKLWVWDLESLNILMELYGKPHIM